VPSFFSRGDTATPVKVAAVALFINILIKIVLIDPFGFKLGLFPPMNQEGIALGTSAGAIVNALLLGLILIRRRLLHLNRDFARRAVTIVSAAAAMGAALFFLPQAFAALSLTGGVMARIALVGAVVAVGSVSYGQALIVLRYPILNEMRSALSRR
jgi:putative peptidoglycan lipid II flippase